MFWRRNRVRNRRKERDGSLLRLPALNWRRFLPAGAVLLVLAAAVFAVLSAMDQPVQVVDVSGRFQRVPQWGIRAW